MFFIRVQTGSDYKYIREDRWETPVRTNVQSDAKLFETAAAAVEYVRKFNLVGSFYEHEIIDSSTDNAVFLCWYKPIPNTQGQYSLDVKAVK